jgi:hypothetical protein
MVGRGSKGVLRRDAIALALFEDETCDRLRKRHRYRDFALVGRRFQHIQYERQCIDDR